MNRRLLLLPLLLLLSICTVFSQAPIAKIGATPIAGCAPLGVSFKDASTGGAATSWNWNFGSITPGDVSPATGTSRTAAVIYAKPGTYTVTLTVSNASGSSVASPVTITVFPAPVADFNVSKTTGCYPTDISFTDNSNGGPGATITSWLWDFGDGSTGNIASPTHTYLSGGSFPVSLYVKNNYGCYGNASIKAVSGAIVLSNGVIPNFSPALQNSCQLPINATFTNQTTGPAALSYVWDFGDGSPQSAGISPSHTYTTPGNYKVKLTATSTQGCQDTVSSTVAIASSSNISSFDAPIRVCLNTPVSFTNTSSPYPSSSSWNYGDGSPVDNVRNGAHTYTATGNYAVILNNVFASCSGSDTQHIEVVTPPTTDFTGTNLNACKPPLTVSFTDQSVGATSWLWSFGDGTQSTDQNPTHAYSAYNSYTVTLTSSSAGGCSSTAPPKSGFVNITKPIVSIPTLPGYGCAPFTFNPAISLTAVDGVDSYFWDFGNGVTSNLASPPAQIYGTGTYKVKLTIVTKGGCSASDSGTVKVGSVQAVSDFTANTTSVCVGDPIQFNDQSTGGANQWYWDFGDGTTSTLQSPSHSYGKPKTYTVKLIAYNDGCYAPMPKTITVVVKDPLADFSYSFNCASKATYTFTDASTGPTGWDWDFGDGSPHFAGQTPPPHTYAATLPTDFTVILKVTNGACSNPISKKITVNQSSSVTVSANPVCNNTPVTITAHVPAYVTSYIYSFGDGNYSGSVTKPVTYTYPASGNYDIKVITTDNTGCVDSSQAFKMQVSGPTVKFTSSAQSFCATPATQTFQVQFTDQTTTPAGSSIAKWEWDFGDGQKSAAQNPLHIYTNEGNYPVKLKVTDNLGCTDSLILPGYITFSKPVAKFITDGTDYCPLSNIKITNTSSSVFGNAQYTWDFGDGSAQFIGPNPPSHNYPAIGQYSITLNMVDAKGCAAAPYTNPTKINIDEPVASFTVDKTYSACPPLPVQYSFTGSYAKSYLWTFSEGGAPNNVQNPLHTYNFPGDFYATLTVTSPGGCTKTVTGPTIHIDGPVGNFTYTPLAACNDVNVFFEVKTANVAKFTWIYGDGSDPEVTTIPTSSHDYNIPGVYTPLVFLEDSTGCSVPYTGNDVITVDGITRTAFTADKNLLCDQGTINFKDASVLATGTVINNYLWNFDDGNPAVPGMNPTIANTFSAVKTYNVTLTITTVNGCASDTTIPIQVVASPQISIGGLTSQCEPATLNFTGIETVPDPNGPLTWAWDFGNTQTSTVQNPPAVLYPKAGSYNVTLVATNTKGCTTTYPPPLPAIQQPLLIYSIPAVNAGADTTICWSNPSSPFLLNATGDNGNTYNWQTTANGTLSCYPCASPVATASASTYFVVNGQSPFGCKASDTINVTVNVPVTVSVSPPDSVCLGQGAPLVASGAALYEWTPADGLSDPSIANPVATPTGSMLGTDPHKIFTYQVTGYDSKKCFSDVKTIDITAFNYPTLDAGPNVTIPVGTSYQINGAGSPDIVSLNWLPPTALSCSNCLTPLATPIKTTNYVLQAVNDGGCTASDSIKITVICDGSNFFLPNTFSPNGDGANDRFIVRGRGLNVIPSITIFNRWGQVVFEKRNFAPNDEASGWDGTYNGKPAPSDVYIYTIQILCDNATLIPYHGNVTLIR